MNIAHLHIWYEEWLEPIQPRFDPDMSIAPRLQPIPYIRHEICRCNQRRQVKMPEGEIINAH